MFPVPRVEAPLQPCDDVIHVANGAAVAITSTTSLGNQLCYIAPTFDSALLPQSTIESQGAISVLYNQELKIFNATSNPQLISAITDATPIITSKQENGDYEISLPDIRRLFLPPPSLPLLCSPIPPNIKTASIAQYYTSQFNNLRDLVLYYPHMMVTIWYFSILLCTIYSTSILL